MLSEIIENLVHTHVLQFISADIAVSIPIICEKKKRGGELSHASVSGSTLFLGAFSGATPGKLPAPTPGHGIGNFVEIDWAA